MFITVGNNTYDLQTKLGVSIKIEQKFKQPLTQIFANIDNAEIPEMISILAIAAGKHGDPKVYNEFEADILDNWDYTDLQLAGTELIVNLLYSGTEEQIEKKLEKFPASEDQKNAFREMLGLPKKEAVSTEIYSLEQPTE